MTVDYGGICILANPTLSAGRPLPTRPDAVLVPAVERVNALVDSTALDLDIPIITPPGLVEMVTELGFTNVRSLDVWCQIVLRRGHASVTITALPEGRLTAVPDLAMDTMLEFRSNADSPPYRVCLSSGTASAGDLDDIATRCSRIDLAILSLAPVVLDGTVVGFNTDCAVDIVHRLHPGMTIPVHRLDEVFTWPLRDFRTALVLAGRDAGVQEVRPGCMHVFTVLSRAGVIPSMVPLARVRDQPGMVMTGGS